MSANAEWDDRDLEGELASPTAGQAGIAVDAICVGGRIRVNRANLEEHDQNPGVNPTTLEVPDLTSLKHVRPCEGATRWNPAAVLSGLPEVGGESA